MTRNTTPFLLNLDPSYMDEPRISNDEFLDSLVEIGVWLRVLVAHDSLERYASNETTPAQRMAALSNVYLQLGAQFEDQAVLLVAFSAWSKDRSLVLADLFSRISVRRKPVRVASEIEEVHDKLGREDSKSVPVAPSAFFREAAEMTEAKIVEFFLGYRWKAEPSVRLVPRRHIQVWRNLPGELKRIASSFYEEAQVPRVTAAYNKIKHGPQLVVQNPKNRAMEFSTLSDVASEFAHIGSFDKPSVRILFDGASTSPVSPDGTRRSPAPFLIDDARAVNRVFFNTMVPQATLLSILVNMHIALYRNSRAVFGNLDKGIARIVERAQTLLGR